MAQKIKEKKGEDGVQVLGIPDQIHAALEQHMGLYLGLAGVQIHTPKMNHRIKNVLS